MSDIEYEILTSVCAENAHSDCDGDGGVCECACHEEDKPNE